MIVNTVSLEMQLDDVEQPSIVGYLLNNQGKRVKCKVTIDVKGNIIFSPIEPIEESDRHDIS